MMANAYRESPVLDWLKGFSLKKIINILLGFLSLFAIVCLVMFFIIYIQSKTFAGAWDNLQKGSQQKQEIVTNLSKYMGYGGMIHNFKNYVLRGDDKYLQASMQDHIKIQQNINLYMTKKISKKEAEDLEIVRAVANRYAQAAKEVTKLRQQGATIANIDKKVKINDTPALTALDDLQQILLNQSKNETNSVINLLHEILSYSLAGGVIIILGTLFLITMIFYLGYRLIVRPILAANKSAMNISRGDFTVSSDIKGFQEAESLRASFIKMKELVATEIRKAKAELEIEITESSSLASLSEALAQQDNLEALSKYLTSTLAELVDARCIVFYLIDESESTEKKVCLKIASTYAFKERKHIEQKIHSGEGIVGQCIIEKSPILLTNVPEDYIHIHSALGDKVAQSIYAFPILYNDNVLGVIELASLNDFDDRKQNFLDKIANIIGLNVNSFINREKLSVTLDEAQTLNDKLNEQQSELRDANEMLEEQKKSLQQSEEELRSQSEELRVMNEELEEKTENLEKQKVALQETQEELEQRAQDLALSSKYKSEFLANMSHELRTPLNSLLILSKKLAENKDGNLTEKQVQSAEVINRGGNELLTLINDILDLSKVEAGKLQIDMVSCDIATICSNLHTQFEALMSDKEIAFNVTIDDALPKIFYSDDQRITQVVRNFISNAYKFTSSGSITINVAHPESDITLGGKTCKPQEVIAWSVSDTGIGIPADKQRLIFEAFQQAEGSTSREYGGTGLGLAISKAMAELMGGDIALKSKEGEGSTFILYLPCITEFDGNSNMPQQSVEKAHVDVQSDGDHHSATLADDITHEQQIETDTPTLLIVEDDESFSEILAKSAIENGYEVVKVTTGKEALSEAVKKKPTAIILDLGLPDMDGEQVLAQLKDDISLRHIPIHIVSAKDETPAIKQQGAIGYLKKPLSNTDLTKIFSKFEGIIQTKIKNILLIEDDENSQLAIRELLDEQTIEIHAEKSGEAAINYLKDNRVDCIILDLNLDGMTGFEVLDKVSENNESLPPVVVYTGRELSEQEYERLQQYTSSIVIKGVSSPNRLLDEVTLFLHSVDSDLSADRRKTVRMLHSGDAILKDKTVLLVDDDMRNVFALTAELEDYDIEVVVATNGEISLQRLDEHPEIDLVLMDIMMPVMDGYTAIKAIRQDDRFKELPIIALTAKAMPEDKEKCLNVGASDYIAKPVDIDQLMSMMKIWMSKQ